MVAERSYMGEPTKFLGINIVRDGNNKLTSMFLHQIPFL